MLFDIGAGRGDAELSALFGVPMAILPEAVDCAAGFGIADRSHLGAGCLAGLHAGLCPPSSELAAGWALERRFEPGLAEDARDAAYAGWRRAVGRTPSAA